jgi:hypothetical protein
MNYTLSNHAKERMQRWQISREILEATLLRPEGRVHDQGSEFFLSESLPLENRETTHASGFGR